MTPTTQSLEQLAEGCSIGSCNRHKRCMYLNHPRCPLAALRTQQEVPNDGR
jgi:hypothetical protein